MGTNAVQKQILKIILISDNVPTWEQQREALFTARAQLPPDEWLLVIDEWELAYGMSNIIIFREVARLDSEEKTPLFAREFNAIFLGESKDFKLPLLKEFSFESWKCKNIDGYKLCSKLLDD